MTSRPQPERLGRPPVPGLLGLPLGLVAGAAGILLALETGGASAAAASVILLVVVVDVIAAITTSVAAVAATTWCWALHAYLVLDPEGELTLTGQSARDAVVLALNTLGVLFVASSIRAARTRHLDRRAPRRAGPRPIPAGRLDLTAASGEGTAVMGTSDQDMLDSVADMLNTWNRHRPDPVRCGHVRHGRMRAEPCRQPERLRWRCQRCDEHQPVAPGQIADALNASVTRGLSAASHDADTTRTPAARRGECGDGTVRVRRRLNVLGVNVRLTTVEIYAIHLGAALSALALWFLPGVMGFLTALGVSLAAAMAVRIRYPAAEDRAECEVQAVELRPGDWVRLGATGRAAGLASQVVAVTSQAREQTGGRNQTVVELLNGNHVASSPAHRWIRLDLSR